MIVILHYYNENWHEGDDRRRRQSGTYIYNIYINIIYYVPIHYNGTAP